MIRETDVAWLAGVFDADGSLAPARKSEPNGLWGFRIAMTHKPTIIRVCSILQENGIAHSYCEQTCKTTYSREDTTTQLYSVGGQSRKGVADLVHLLEPYSTTKRAAMSRYFISDFYLLDAKEVRKHG